MFKLQAAHLGHVSHLLDVPSRQRRVEPGGFVEHRAHVGDLAGIPGADSVTEGGSAFEPGARITWTSCETLGGMGRRRVLRPSCRNKYEHVRHRLRAARRPGRDVLVEALRVRKDPSEVGNRRNVPVPQRLVKADGAIETVAHISVERSERGETRTMVMSGFMSAGDEGKRKQTGRRRERARVSPGVPKRACIPVSDLLIERQRAAEPEDLPSSKVGEWEKRQGTGEK